MKRQTACVLTLLTLSLVYVASVHSNCPPTWNVTGETSEGCPNPYKSMTWLISWQDTTTSTKSNEAFGQCYNGWFSTTECPPVFAEPTTFPITIQRRPYQEWSQTAYDRKYDGECKNNGYRTARVTHRCTSSGGFCGGGLVYSPTEQPSSEDASTTLADPYCCDDIERMNCYQGGGEWDDSSCSCVSPILIDVSGDGFDLTNVEGGVRFDITNDGVREQVSWTSADSDDAWLALDRNGNGRVDNGRELFGSSSPQPYLTQGETKHGFRALAVYDKSEFGGNGDGQIDERDGVFSQLRLWLDRNHNGVSEPGELGALSDSAVRTIELRYHESRRQDEHGNWFRYRAKVRDAHGAQVGRWAWDVFLHTAP